MPNPKTTLTVLTLAVGMSLAPTLAAAQIKTPAGYLFPQLSLASDYRYNGFSNSDRQPSVQADLYLWRPDGFYAGAEASRVRFHDGSHIDFELDVYGGRNIDLGKTRLTLEAMAVTFPDQQGPAPTYGFVQGRVKASRGFGRLTLTADAAWTPQGSYHSGQGLHLAGEARFQAAPWLNIGGEVGSVISERAQDRVFWDLGLTFKRRNLAFDLRYTGTDLSEAQCFHTDRCAPGLVSKLTWSLPLKSKGTS